MTPKQIIAKTIEDAGGHRTRVTNAHWAAAIRLGQLELIGLLRESIPCIEHCIPPPSHPGPCGGPNGNCDASCVEIASLAGLLERINAALEAMKK